MQERTGVHAAQHTSTVEIEHPGEALRRRVVHVVDADGSRLGLQVKLLFLGPSDRLFQNAFNILVREGGRSFVQLFISQILQISSPLSVACSCYSRCYYVPAAFRFARPTPDATLTS